jgi:PKD domain/Chlamydia polymorphic membrane protein (Chlamydia_PMP) repeat
LWIDDFTCKSRQGLPMLPLDSASESPRRRKRRPRALRPGVDRLESRTLPATFVVNSPLDAPDTHPGDGVAQTADGQTTLRAAVMEANATTALDTIILPAGAYRLTLVSTPFENFDAKGDLDIVAPIALHGAGSRQSIIDALGAGRIFDLRAAGPVTITDVTLTGGQADVGGAIRAEGAGDLTLMRTVVRQNRASENGGALAALEGPGRIDIGETYFQSNSAEEYAGAIYAVNRELGIHGSTFADNSAEAGGATAAIDGNWIIARSTFSGNRASIAGGAIAAYRGSRLTIASSTIAENAATHGGGVYAGNQPEIGNTILAGNTAALGPNFFGRASSLGFNLVGNAGESSGFGKLGDRLGTPANPLDARLAPLTLYGGLTPTRLPLPGSPALDAGQATEATDQRGVPRPATGADIGAVEARTFTLVRLPATTSTRVGTAFAPLRVRFLEGDIGIAGVVVTFAAPPVGASGTFAGLSTVITDADGVATAPTFTANSIPGAFTVRASIAGGVFLDFPLTNLPGASAQIDMQGPSAARAGDTVQLDLAIRDAFGNLVPDFTGRVFLSSTDPQATLPPSIDFTAADRGVAHVTFAWRTAGPQRLTLTGPGLSATSEFNVSPGPAAAMSLTGPATIRAGDPLALHVTLRDAFGNVAIDFTGPVTFTSTDPIATLPAGAAFTAADRGARDFPLRLRTAGTVTVTITAGGLHATINVAVTAAAATRLDLAGQSSARAGDGFLLTATARDAFGNVATGFTGLATFLSDDVHSTLPHGGSFTLADAGVKVFSLIFRTAGARSVTLGAGGLTRTYSLAVTPGAVNHFTLAAPSAVNEGDPLALTITAFDAFGNIATNYTGTVAFTSNDPRAELPAATAFTSGDAGVHTFHGLVFRSPGGRTLHVADASSGVQADAPVAVANLGPRDLTVTTSVAQLDEGQSLTFSGTFTNVDSADTHTVVIRWGDGSPDSTLNLAAAVTEFSATHAFADNATAAIHVTVTDSQGGSAMADRAVRSANVAPTLVVNAPAGAAIDRVGESFTMGGSFTDPGSDSWTATVDYGDGSGVQSLSLSDDKRFALHHVYTAEGTFTVVVRVADDDGGVATFRERVAVLLPGTANVRVIVIGPGETGHISTSNYDVAFTNNSTTTPAVFLAGLVDRGTIERLPDQPTDDPNANVIAVDFRALDADPRSKLTIVFHYEPTGVTPELKFFDEMIGKFQAFHGSSHFANSFVIDRVNHTVTITIDGSTSVPTLAGLNGTLFTLTVPTPPMPTPNPTRATQVPFFVQAKPIGATGPSDAAGARPTATTTSLSAGGELTLTLASSEGLRRSGSDSDSGAPLAPKLPAVIQFIQDVFALRQVIYEAYRMWLEHPAPIEAPALLPPPQIDELETWQIKLDSPAPELREDAPIEIAPKATAAAVPPVPLDEPDSLVLDAANAVAQRKPWWLAEAAPAAPAPSSAEDPVAGPQVTSEPTEDQRAMAALAGIWIGGHALAMTAPHVPEEEPADPRRTKLKVRGKPEEK